MVRALASNRLVQAIGVGVALTLVLTAVWKFTPLAEVVTLERSVEWVEAFSSSWWAPTDPARLHAASFVMFPRRPHHRRGGRVRADQGRLLSIAA